MLTSKPIVALICVNFLELRRLSSLLTFARCTALTKKCRVHCGKVVKAPPFGTALAWPLITLLSGLLSHAATKV